MADLDSSFTFENFVVGPANRLASAAARRAAEVPGASYNPLFVYSASGLGKTHILGGIAHYVSKIHPDKEVVYQTLEGFLGELTESLEGGHRDVVRSRYENLDILLMDDVQFLAGQAEAQEMLLRALDSLTGEGKQIVLASDRPPADIDRLDARLRSRFEGGLLVDIGSPEYETRVAIIRKRADARGQTLAPGVAEAVGRIPFRNVRELGGALNRVLAIQELEGRTVTADEIDSLLGAGERGEERGGGTDLGDFLSDLSESVAEQVEAQEAPWRKRLRDVAEEAEARDFKADRLRRLMERDSPVDDVDTVVREFQSAVERLERVGEELEEVGNPWPEAAHGVLRDPERLEEAETLLASARERARPFPELPAGPDLEGLGGEIPQLVLRAATQLVDTDRQEYNPLYVWEPEGDRSKDLLVAAGHSFLESRDGGKVALVSVAEFAEDFITALSRGVAGAWRERWWSAELLLVHGAEDLSQTERAQDEFFHLFEALQRRRARVMVAARCPPSRIRGIDDRLRSRFEGGLVLEVEPMGGEAAGEESVAEPAGAEEEKAEEAIIPPLDQLVPEDGGRGGLFVEAQDADGEGEGPVAADEAPDAEERGDGEAGGSDVSALDREWIMKFTAGESVQLGRDVSEEEDTDDVAGAKASEEPEEDESFRGSWFPSPERVVWEWPRIEERIVEEAD